MQNHQYRLVSVSSDNGIYLGVGTISGSVSVYIAFNLQVGNIYTQVCSLMTRVTSVMFKSNAFSRMSLFSCRHRPFGDDCLQILILSDWCAI